MEFVVLLLVLALAFANGANDVPKGVATVVGARLAGIRTALIWATAMTVVGSLISLQLAEKMTKLFSSGIVSATPTAPFAAAVLIGTAGWVALATVFKLPVSTTHALIGSLLGAGAVFASSAVQWNALLVKLAGPLLLSVVVAYGLTVLLTVISRVVRAKLFARSVAAQTDTPQDQVLVGAGGPTVTRAATGVEQKQARKVGAAHWLTSGLTSMARGMNDTPKIVAIGSFALVAGMTPTTLAIGVATAMAAGGLLVGSRIAGRMAHGVLQMRCSEGFAANLTTSVLVGLGAFQGLPMSTTHVSNAAIAGSAGTNLSRLKGKTLRDFALAWLVTPPFAAAVAAVAYLVLG